MRYETGLSTYYSTNQQDDHIMIDNLGGTMLHTRQMREQRFRIAVTFSVCASWCDRFACGVCRRAWSPPATAAAGDALVF